MSVKRDLFFSMQSPSDVASLLGVSNDVLNHRIYRQDNKYFHFEIPKKSGETREISAPNTGLKLLQKSLNEVLQEVYEPRPSVHGFVKNRSIRTNAKAHKKQKYVLNIDIKDFFPSIHFGRVRGLFMANPFNLSYEVSTTLARICCTYDGLPQGAPTSPVISNMICRGMDGSLQFLAKRHQCFYTRYADDITLSTSKSLFPTSLAKTIGNNTVVGESLQEIIRQNGFEINQNKVRLQNRHQRQQVTGLTVNQFPNVNRKYINQVRAMIHDLNKDEDKALERHLAQFRSKHHNPNREQPSSFREIVRGKVEYIGQVRGKHDKIYRRFLEQLGVYVAKPKIFINYAREDENEIRKIHDILQELDFDLWIDTEGIYGGAEWEKEIYKAIDERHIFIACLTVHSVSKGGVLQEEIDYALKKYRNSKPHTFFIMPLLLMSGLDNKIRNDLKEFNYVKYYEKDGFKNLQNALQEIISLLSI